MKNKKLIWLFAFSSIFLGIALLATKEYYVKKKARFNIQIFKKMPIVNLDSVAFDHGLISRNDYLIIVYYNGDCQPCRSQVIELKKNLHYLDKSSSLFISSESIAKIENFRNELDLKKIDNFFFSKIMEDKVFEVFGSVITPQVFIYNNEGTLLKEFKGGANVKAINNYLE